MDLTARGRLAAILLAIAAIAAIAALFTAVLASASPAGALPLASLTLKPAPGTHVDAHHCTLVTPGRDFKVTGRLAADIVGVGVLGQTIELLVDGRHAAVATTDMAGKYAAALSLNPASHRIVAKLRLPTDPTPLEPTVSAVTSAVGIQSPELATCPAPTHVDVKPACTGPCPPGKPSVQGHRPTTDPGNTDPIHPPVVHVSGTDSGDHIVVPPRCSFARSCPLPNGSSCRGSRFLCSVPPISAIWHLPKHVPVLMLLAMIFCMAFPSALFDSTLEANYAHVTRWFGGSAALVRRASRRLPALVKLALFVLAAAAAFTVTERNQGPAQTLAALVGFAAALVLVIAAFELPALLQARRHRAEFAVSIRCLPGGLITAVACAAVSRALHLDQPYVYGVVAGFVVTRGTRDDRHENVGAARVALSVSLMTIGAWVLWSLVGAWTAQQHAPFSALLFGHVLATTFVAGLESLLINFLPLRFLDGASLRAWSRRAWAAVEGAALVLFVLVVSYPDPGHLDPKVAPSGHITLVPGVLFAAFALGSFAFWGYFRLWGAERPVHEVDAGMALIAV